ncbi:hypothetical protein HYH02_001186 [Chlamydomonas schloesseri]|uniref:LrgB-like protein n=1 Tax=Chlamydomonas schloesseri TaxID=2026947 RepID=A0A835WUW3_9CHLO|nr:hypothetical protein HYH02_001186 [Chlamydomonas schloesseri]|eukprot:KAG2454150.1 hypothetical protein HYH02_001186 [Chlamydomonas schloesseri]
MSDEHKRKVEVRAWINAWRARSGLAPMPTSSVSIQGVLPPAQSASAGGAAAPASQPAFLSDIGEYVKLVSGLASLYALDMAIKKAFTAAGIVFPSALGGMFGIVVLLLLVGDKAASSILSFYSPALNWIAKWLPLFYVASLVTLPLALKGIAGSELIKIMIILGAGMCATLLFTAQVTVFIRELVKTENKEIAKAKPASPFLPSHFVAWGAVAAASLAATAVGGAGSALGAQMALPFGLAATVGGYLLGNAVPKTLQGLLHPVVVTALVANAGAALHGAVYGVSYDASLKMYYSKNLAAMGAGDFLMAFLGCVIVSFGFRIYQQRETMKRHYPEILGATFLSALFSFFSTAFAAKALALNADLARALIPRSVTVALALPIATQLDAPLSITAAAVLLQGLLGANFGPNLMSAVGIKDTIARGLAAAGTAGGLGTASLTSKEPEALPFCALSYSLVGILSTFLAATPLVRNALLGIVG